MKLSIISKLSDISVRDEIIWSEIDDVFTNYYDIISTIDDFISHLMPNHQVPGKVYEKLLGIADNIREEHSYTDKQARYVALALAGYWNESLISHVIHI